MGNSQAHFANELNGMFEWTLGRANALTASNNPRWQ
jgi:hypothetical protein